MRKIVRVAVATAFGWLAVTTAATSARADWDQGGRGGWGREHDWREHDWREHDRREHDWREREWRGYPQAQEQYRYGFPPPVIYAPQPRYYAPSPRWYSPPPTLYAQPPGFYGN